MHTVEQAEQMIFDDVHILTLVVTCALNSDDCAAFQHILELVQAKDDIARETAVTRLHGALHRHIHEHAVGAVEMQRISTLLTTPTDPQKH